MAKANQRINPPPASIAQPIHSPRWAALAVMSLILFVVVVVIYSPVFVAGFVDFDDPDYVFSNPWVMNGVNAGSLRWAFAESHSSNWHPLTWISHMVDVELFGLDPRGHHATNVLLHAVNVVLLFWLLRYLTNKTAPSLFVAALFGVCPVNVETVAWIAQRKTTLSTTFALLSLWLYARYVRKMSRRSYGGSLVAFAFSLMSKQTFVTLPLLLLLLDWWPLARTMRHPPIKDPSNADQRLWPGLLAEKIPFLLLSVAAAIVTLIVQQRSMRSIDSYPIAVRLGNVALSYVHYLKSLLWPVNLAVFYPLEPSEITAGHVLFSGIALLLITVAAWHLGRGRPFLIIGWLWFVIALIPVIGIVHVGAQAAADRYVYAAYWGLFVALVWWSFEHPAVVNHPWLRRCCGSLIFAVVVIWGALSFRQSQTWHSSETLFTQAAAVTKNNHVAHRVLADHYFARSDYQRALTHSTLALEAGRDRGRILATYGLTLFELGRTEPALAALRESVTSDPGNPTGFINLGWVLAELGQHSEAIQQFERAAHVLSPGAPPYAFRTLHANWGRSLLQSGSSLAAAEHLQKALDYQPESSTLQSLLAEAELQHDPPQAVQRLQDLLHADPDNFVARSLLAKGHLSLGDITAAEEVYRSLSAQQPANVEIALALSGLQLHTGKLEAAISTLKQTIDSSASRANPQSLSMLYAQLGLAVAKTGNRREALDSFTESIRRWEDNPLANNNAAWLLATSPDEHLRDAKRAILLAQRACMLTSDSPGSLGTLAAAHAADQNFAEAVRIAKQAIASAQEAGKSDVAESLTKQLACYEVGEPYLEPQQ